MNGEEVLSVKYWVLRGKREGMLCVFSQYSTLNTQYYPSGVR
jgi:hypothetical protein